MSCVVKTEFSFGLIKLRNISLNLLADTMFRISSLSANHFLIEYGQKDELKTLVLHLESSSCFDMLTLIEDMRARAHSQLYGRKITYETIFYLPEILGQFLDKDDPITCCTFNNPSNSKSCPILNHF